VVDIAVAEGRRNCLMLTSRQLNACVTILVFVTENIKWTAGKSLLRSERMDDEEKKKEHRY